MFKTSICLSTVFIFCALAMTPVSGQVDLFEKKNLAEWDFFVEDKEIAVGDVFSFTEDGILACKGKPFGYLATKELYKNYKISLEYRWPKDVKPTNSGIFLRITDQPPKTFLPKCFEVQLAHNSAGDLWGFHGRKLPAPPGSPEARVVEADGNEIVGKQNGVKRILGVENKPGEWNALDILCSEGLIVVVLNGKIVNWATDAEVVPGKIGFQSEGGPVEFRNAVLNVLP